MKGHGKPLTCWLLLIIVWLPTSNPFSIARPRERSQTRRSCLAAVSPHHDIISSSAAVASSDTATALETPTAISSPPLESPVIYPNIPTADTRVWKPLCPTVWENARGVVDVRGTWKKPATDAVTTRVAEQMAASLVADMVLQKDSSTITKLQQHKMQATLTQALGTFMTFCNAHLQPTAAGGYTARIVATRGSPSTKCPAWHQDHVPVRWIQSLQGPGCEWVEVLLNNNENDNHDNKNAWASAADENNDNDDEEEEEEEESLLLSVEDLNQRRVPAGTPTYQAAPGQAVILVGRLWKETCRRDDERHLEAVVHKSPSGLPPWQGRVLLTMDVLAPPLHDDDQD